MFDHEKKDLVMMSFRPVFVNELSDAGMKHPGTCFAVATISNSLSCEFCSQTSVQITASPQPDELLEHSMTSFQD